VGDYSPLLYRLTYTPCERPAFPRHAAAGYHPKRNETIYIPPAGAYYKSVSAKITNTTALIKRRSLA